MEVEISPEIETRSLTTLEQAKAFQISDNEVYQQAGNLYVGLKALEKEIVTAFAEPKKKADEAHKAVVALERKTLEKPRQAMSILWPKLKGWEALQEQKRRDEERRLQAEQRKREEEDRIKEAEALEAEGKKEEAEAVISKPIEPPPVIVPKLTPKVEGLRAGRENWKFEIVDAKQIKPPYLCPDTVAIGETVRRLKQAAADIVGGIRVWMEKV